MYKLQQMMIIIDPDSNIFNHLDNDNKYYLPGEVKPAIDKLNICNSFSVVHINARSLMNKLDNLQILLESTNIKFDVIAVSETWKTDLSAHLIYINGYNKISNRRFDGRQEGGVALFVKNSIDYGIKTTANIKTFESVFIEISCEFKQKMVLGTIYRPPNTDLSNFNIGFESVLKPLLNRNVKCILCGDYNINLLNHLSNIVTRIFLNNLFDLSVLLVIKRPT